ncbi:MAG TPA: nucleotidyltransferase domain-containing protein [Firmicutes bacterium]|nr:nucleotidyltransferase domain-containing protein [Bacillota bacterium]
MARTARDLSDEEIEAYRRSALLREREWRVPEERMARAWDLARKAAALLREKFGATRVVVFGSLLREGCFTPWSDVDVAAWNLRPEDTFRAIGTVYELDPEIEVNLVDVNACSPSLRAIIEAEGVDL